MSDSTEGCFDWKTLDRILSRLLELDQEDRNDSLNQIQHDNPSLAAQLRRMLDAAAGDEPPIGLAESTIGREAFVPIEMPKRLGHWTLLRCIGSGGMADVYEASREIGDSSQRSAIKLIRGNIGSSLMKERFDQETGILARLEDPRMARLLDAGVANDGRPWLAMEYVDGLRIDEACDRAKLNLRKRIELLIEVCEAVAHAHQHLIVHRDLKPGNILIDADGRVRLLDFGIATLADGKSENPLPATHERAYTLRYASPEQLRGQRTGTSTDIFQLGLIAYFLVTGGSPYSEPIIDADKRLGELLRGPRPASRTCLQMGALKVEMRDSSLRRLVRQCHGDIDAILAIALAPEPEDRYESASAMKEDLKRWLAHQPVHARTSKWSYHTVRFVRRNWIATSGVLLVIVGMAAFLTISILHNRQLTFERDLARAAQQRSDSLHRFVLDVFGSVDTNVHESRGKSVDDLVRIGLERADEEFADEPELAARLILDMASLLQRRSQLDEAIAAHHRGIELRTETLGADHEDTLDAWNNLVYALIENGQWAEADSLSLDQLERARAALGTDHRIYIETLLVRARAVSKHQSHEAEIPILEEVQRLMPGLRGVDPRELRMIDAHLYNQLGSAYAEVRRWEDAEPMLANALKLFESEFGPEDGRTQLVRMNYAAVLRGLGRFDEARAALERLLTIQRDFYDHANWRVSYTLGHLAGIASSQNRFDEAIDLWQQAIDGMSAAVDEDHPQITRFIMARARDMLRGGHCDEGRSILESLAEREDLTIQTRQSVATALIEIPCPDEQ